MADVLEAEILTVEIYGIRKGNLVGAIAAAEGEVHLVKFKVKTGAASAEDLDRSKAHLAALKESLEDLESEWIGTQIEAKKDREREALNTFERGQVEIGQALATRAASIVEIEDLLGKLLKPLVAYRQANSEIRLALQPLMHNAGPGSDDIRAGIFGDLGHLNAERLISAFTSEHLPNMLCTDWRNPFFGQSASEFEARVAGQIKSAVDRLAPQDRD